MKALNLTDRLFKNCLGGHTKSSALDGLRSIIHSNTNFSIKPLPRDYDYYFQGSNRDHLKIIMRDRKKNGKALSRYIRTIQNEPNIESKTQLAVSYLIHLKLNYDNKTISKIEPRYFEIEEKWNTDEWKYFDINSFGYPLELRDLFSQMNILFNVHYSLADESLIAYYPSLKHYRDGREVRTRLGKFLARFKDEFKLTDDAIKIVVDRFNAEIEKDRNIKLTILNDSESNADEWANVYENDSIVRSCMSNRGEAIKTYCTGRNELSLAFLMNGDNKVVSRTIIRTNSDPESHGYIRFYPSTSENKYSILLKNMIAEKGFINQVDLNGAYLKAIEDHSGNHYAPYLDGSANYADFTSDTKLLIIGYEGDYCLDTTHGYLGEDIAHCCCCDETHHQDDMHWINDDTYCDSCVEENFKYSEYHDQYIRSDDAVWVSCKEDYYFYDDSFIVWVEDEGKYYHIDDDDIVFLERKDKYVHRDNVIYSDFYDELILENECTIILFFLNDSFISNEIHCTEKNCHYKDIKILPNGERVHESEYDQFIHLLNTRGF